MATPAALAASARPAVGNRIGVLPATPSLPRADVPDARAFAPSLNPAAGNLSDAVVGLIDSIRKLLSTLPANPVSEFLSGALYLVRRTLKPVGVDVGLFGTVACVATKNCSDKDLAGADLSGRNLTALDFTGAVLNGVDFSGADLSQADLSGSRLREANLTDANLRDANLLGADLLGADLDGVTNFATATLTGADLSGQILLRLDLSGKDLTGTDFSGAILSGTDLSGANLSDADFEWAGLAGVNLSSVDLTGANLDRADLSDVIWGDTPCPGGVDCAPGGDAAAADTGGGAVDAVLTGSVDQGLLGSDPSIATNPAYSYQDAILAAQFSELAYKWRESDFKARVEATGWQGITPPTSGRGPGGFTTPAGGYGVGAVTYDFQDGMPVQSFAFAGRRTAGDGTEQFVFAVEGSNACSLSCLVNKSWSRAYPGEDRADWNANLQSYGWSRYYASLQPLMAEVLRQMIEVQKSGSKAQLIITGHSLGGATAMIAYADLLAPRGDLYPADPSPVGSVQVTDRGSGYDSLRPPLVRFEGGGGTGATAIAVVPDREDESGYFVDYVTEVRITNPGSGYTFAPKVIVEPPDGVVPGRQAEAIATLNRNGGTDVLANGKRIWDKIGDWTPATIKAVQDATTVYTFGAPSPLIDPVKDPQGLNGVLEKLGVSAFDYTKLWEVVTSLTVDQRKLPQPFRSGTVGRIFQFEHKGGTFPDRFTPNYADDVVANIGSSDPGNVIPIRLRPDVQESYVGCRGLSCVGLYGLSAATHSIGLYSESLIRLVTWDALLDNSTPVEGVVGSSTWRTGSDQRNDVFRQMVPSPEYNVGKGGNDWFAPTLVGGEYDSYIANGGPGSDLYALYQTNLGLTVDGRLQSGTDGAVFYGLTNASKISVEVERIEVPNPSDGRPLISLRVTYTSRNGNKYSTLQISNWDRWAPSDVFYTKNADGRVTLARIANVKAGPTS